MISRLIRKGFIHSKTFVMKTQTMSLPKLFMLCVYVALIFSLLALIRTQSQHLRPHETGNATVPVRTVQNTVV